MSIKILDSHLISQIAAGEVVERPNSVVKELLENSLDAGATEINLEVEKGGIKSIRLRDNGSGIPKPELKLALSRHATSKIQSLDDLEHVKSLGFRGEALASISSVARFKMISKVAGESSGWQIATEGMSQEPVLEPCSHPVGTTVEISDLFFNIPARRKFLKTEATEFSHILEMMGRLALSRFDVSFSFKHNCKIVWSLPVAKNTRDYTIRVGEIIGKEFIENAYYLDVGSTALKLTGWISQPNYTRSQPDLQYLYINGRIVRDKNLSHAIKQAYQDLIFGQRHPIVVLYLTIDPTLVDVNVHPSKAEVRFRDSRQIHDFAAKGLKDALVAGGAQQFTENREPQSFKIQQNQILQSKKEYFPMIKGGNSKLVIAQERAVYGQLANFAKKAPVLPDENSQIGSRLDKLISKEDIKDIVDNKSIIPPLGFALAQLHGTYILAENAEGLVIVDAHAAHERINYEQLKKSYQDSLIPTQMLLLPLNLTLNQAEMNCVESNFELFQKLGFALTRSSPDTIMVRSVPVLLQEANVEQLVKDVIADFLTYGCADSITKNSNELLATMACHGSIRGKRKLSIEEMNTLLRTIEQTDNSGQCGHGRPTWLPFTLTNISKMFWRQ